MKDDSVSVGWGKGAAGIRRTIALGATSAMVDTGSPEESNNTPRTIWDPGRNLILRRLGPKTGVHLIRTITTDYIDQNASAR
jgi:hypothetical protein